MSENENVIWREPTCETCSYGSVSRGFWERKEEFAVCGFMDCSAKAEPYVPLSDLEKLKAENEKLLEALRPLMRLSESFVRDTPLSAETVWGALPGAVEKARAALAGEVAS